MLDFRIVAVERESGLLLSLSRRDDATRDALASNSTLAGRATSPMSMARLLGGASVPDVGHRRHVAEPRLHARVTPLARSHAWYRNRYRPHRTSPHLKGRERSRNPAPVHDRTCARPS